MSLNINTNPAVVLDLLAQELELYEEFSEPFVLEQADEPSQKDWEDAWQAAGRVIPLEERTELYWKSGEDLRGQFGRIADYFYCLFPSRSVVLGGVTHFEFTKFLGWEDGEHFFLYGQLLDDAGLRTGLFRVYADGMLEALSFVGFTPSSILAYDESQHQVWYLEGTSLKRLNTLSSVITPIAPGITVAPTEVVFDNSGNAFFRMNNGSGIRIYRWDATSSSLSSVKSSITVNGVGESPGEVILATPDYVFVRSSQDNYWIQIHWQSGVETRLKSNPSGASPANLPIPAASDWNQVFAYRQANLVYLVYAELAGSTSLIDWKRTIIWDTDTASYQDQAELPSFYARMIEAMINTALNPDPLIYRHDPVYFVETTAYRSRNGNNWDYNNILHFHSNIALTVQLLESTDGQIFWLSSRSSGKIWRLSDWDYGESDMVLLDCIPITGVQELTLDLSQRPAGYDRIEISLSNAGNDGGAILPHGFNWNLANTIVAQGLDVDNNTYAYSPGMARGVLNSTQGSLVLSNFFLDQGTSLYPNLIISKSTVNSGVVNMTVQYTFSLSLGDGSYTTLEQQLVGAGFAIGGYLMIRAFRTEGRRKGGSYYAPNLA